MFFQKLPKGQCLPFPANTPTPSSRCAILEWSHSKHGSGFSGRCTWGTRRTLWEARSCRKAECKNEKAGSTLRSSRAVPHPSTNRALCRLTSEFGRDPVHSTRYGRQQRCLCKDRNDTNRCCASERPGCHRSHFGSRYPLGPMRSRRPSFS